MDSKTIERAMVLLEQLRQRQVSIECISKMLQRESEWDNMDMWWGGRTYKGYKSVLTHNLAANMSQAEYYKKEFFNLVFNELL